MGLFKFFKGAKSKKALELHPGVHEVVSGIGALKKIEKSFKTSKDVADNLPLDENNPPEEFFKPSVGNLFGNDDEPTLAGRTISTVYDSLLERPGKKNYPPHLLKEEGEKSFNDMKAYLAYFQSQGNNHCAFVGSRKPGTTSFSLEGESMVKPMYTKDHLFYFDKTGKEWKKQNPPLVRGYVTLNPNQNHLIQRHFADLSNELYKNGIDFRAKAASPSGMLKRTDNMVFYIADYDQEKAGNVMKSFLSTRGIGQGHVSAAISSPQEGLSWAAEPSERDQRMWQEISGSTNPASYNIVVATKAMPDYLLKVGNAHERKGDSTTAKKFYDEASRTKEIIKNYS